MRALVTDAEYRMSLAVIRALGQKGVKVTALSHAEPQKSLGFYSRYTQNTQKVSTKAERAQAFTDEIWPFLLENDALIPVTLDSVLAASLYREKIGEITGIAVASPQDIAIANDTLSLIEIAKTVDVPVPLTLTLEEGMEVEELAAKMSYPAVIKYRRGEELKLTAAKRYAIVKDKEEFIRTYTMMHNIQPSPLAQEYISGRGFGTSFVFDKKNQPVALFQHGRIREYPASGGPSCFCESIKEPKMVEYGKRLLKKLNWIGVAMVEFKADDKGEFRLMEINPRFWGSLPLAIAAGANLPYALFCVAADLAFEPIFDYRAGVKMRYLLQDLMAFSAYFKKSRSRLLFTLDYLKDFFNPRVSYGVFSLKDPRPAFVYLRNSLKRL